MTSSTLYRPLILGLLCGALAGCGGGAAPINIYMLGLPADIGGTARSDTALGILELARVSLPDYLDSTDLLRRTGPNQLTASATGRWGERLSLGLTDSLAAALSRRLPDRLVVTTPSGKPVQRLFVVVSDVDIDRQGRCRLMAQWRLADSDGRIILDSGDGTISDAALSPDDAAVAMALSHIVDQLAAQIVSRMSQ